MLTRMLPALLAVAASSAGCLDDDGDFLGHSCTLIGYYDGLTVQVDSLPEGNYQLIVAADGTTTTMSFELSQNGRSCEAINPDSYSCRVSLRVGDRTLLIVNDLWLTNGQVVVLYDDGRGDGGPAEIKVRLDHEGALLAAQTYHPVYQASEPNGPGCGTRMSAEESLVVP